MKRLALLPLLALVGCTDLSVEGDPLLSCAVNDDCPEGFFCATALSQCVDEAVLEDAPLTVVGEPSVDVALLSYAEGFDEAVVTIEFNKVPTEGPTAVFDSRFELPCAQEGEDPRYACALNLADNPGELDGGYDVVITAADAAGAVATGRVRVQLDVTPPAVAPGSEVLVYVSGPASPVREVSALSPVSVAQLQLSLTEVPEGTPAVVVATDTAEGRPAFALDEARSSGPLLVLTLDLTDAAAALLADGEHDVELSAVDAVGNAATITLTPKLLVDTTAPAAPDAATAGRVVYRRVPWGALGDPLPRFSVEGLPGAAEAGATLFVNQSDNPASALLGEATVGPDGAFAVALNAIDLPRVFARAVDSAGNLGPAARVQDIEWTASLGGKVSGQTFFNPHALFETRAFNDGALTGNLAREVDRAGDLLEGAALDLDASSARRELRTVDSGAPELVFHSLRFHPALGALVEIGGIDNQSDNRLETRLLDDETWTELPLGQDPPAAAALVYDAARDALLMLLGDETWAFDGVRWAPLVIDPPAPADNPSYAYDPLADRLVRFGGRRDGALIDETWVLEGGAWRELDIAGPSARVDAALGFDAADGQLILYGGRDASGVSGEVWGLSGETWTLLATESPLEIAVAVEDTSSGRVRFICGLDETGARVARLRTWSGAAIDRGPINPQPRTGCAAAYDPVNARLIVHGGVPTDGIGFPNPGITRTVMVLDDGAGEWREIDNAAPVTMGGNNASSKIHFNPIKGRTVLVFGDPGNFISNDTKLWAGRAAESVQVATSFFNADVFFDGANTRAHSGGSFEVLDSLGWAGQAFPPPAPVLPDRAAVTFHPELDAALFFGGDIANVPGSSTLTFRGATVTTLSPANSPPARRLALMVYDDHLSRAVLVGGFDASFQPISDAWVFEAGDWRQIDTPPGDLRSAQLTFDAARGRVVLRRLDTALFDLRGDAWFPLPLEDPGLRKAAFFYDPLEEQLVFSAGDVGTTPVDDIFTWDGGAGARAAHVLELDLSARVAAPDAVVSALVVDAAAGGRGFAKGDPGQAASAVDGARLLGWTRSGWAELGANAAAVDAPADLGATLEGTALAALLRDRVHLALTSAPQGPGGEGGERAALRTSRLEVTVRYREP